MLVNLLKSIQDVTHWNFTKECAVIRKTNQLYLYQYKHKMFESMNVHTHTQQKIMLLTKGNRNIVTQILHCKVSLCIRRPIIPNGRWNWTVQWIICKWPAMGNNLVNKAIYLLTILIYWLISTSNFISNNWDEWKLKFR